MLSTTESQSRYLSFPPTYRAIASPGVWLQPLGLVQTPNYLAGRWKYGELQSFNQETIKIGVINPWLCHSSPRTKSSNLPASLRGNSMQLGWLKVLFAPPSLSCIPRLWCISITRDFLFYLPERESVSPEVPDKFLPFQGLSLSLTPENCPFPGTLYSLPVVLLLPSRAVRSRG